MRHEGAAPGGGTPGHGNLDGDTTIIGSQDDVRKPRRPGSLASAVIRGHLNYFALLSAAQQHDAVHKLARSGMGHASIAAAGGISVQHVGEILAASGAT